ncbi:hypothetical protein ACOSP7_003160 [Xanthoceras sorbifolium]
MLRRLPPKSLTSTRVKCVCKSWQSFVINHNHKLILLSYSCIQYVDYEADEIKAVIPFKVANRMLGIASSNGLLCIAIEKEGLVVWYPLIGRYKMVSWISKRAITLSYSS